MEKPTQKVSRLLIAVESLFEEIFLLLDSGRHAEAVVVQDRCQPLVDEIARVLMQSGVASSLDAATQVRADTLMKRQLAQIERLSNDRRLVTEELETIATALGRTHRFSSAYGTHRDGLRPRSYAGTA